MSRHLRNALIVTTLLALAACGKDSSSPLDPTTPSDPTPPTSGDGTDTPTDTPIVPIDPAIFSASVSGSFTTIGTSYGLLYRSSGPGAYNVGTCTGDPALGTEGTWIDANGTVTYSHHPNCIDYYSNNEVGNNNKGRCTVSALGYIGLWMNPNDRKTSPYHTQCLKLGESNTALTVTFAQPGVVYVAQDGSGQRILNFTTGSAVTAQLYYHGDAAAYTTGTGTITGTDNGSPAGTWSIDVSQTGLNWFTGLYNGDLITALQDTGVPVIACHASLGCDLVTLKMVVAGS
jgi:hypothetical protein